jgi:hypothetical protein
MRLMMASVLNNHASIEFRQKMSAKPTRVAMDELQLHDLKNMDAVQAQFLAVTIRATLTHQQ